MRKCLLSKCFSLSAENIPKCEIIRTYIHVQLEKDVWGRRSCRRHCHTIVHWSCTLLSAVFKRKHQSVVQTTTDWLFHRNPIPSKDRYWCGCLIKHPHIYFTSAVVKLNSKQHGSFQNRAELIFCAIVMLAISVVLFLGSYGQTNGCLSFLLLSLTYIFHPRQRIVT